MQTIDSITKIPVIRPPITKQKTVNTMRVTSTSLRLILKIVVKHRVRDGQNNRMPEQVDPKIEINCIENTEY